MDSEGQAGEPWSCPHPPHPGPLCPAPKQIQVSWTVKEQNGRLVPSRAVLSGPMNSVQFVRLKSWAPFSAQLVPCAQGTEQRISPPSCPSASVPGLLLSCADCSGGQACSAPSLCPALSHVPHFRASPSKETGGGVTVSTCRRVSRVVFVPDLHWQAAPGSKAGLGGQGPALPGKPAGLGQATSPFLGTNLH